MTRYPAALRWLLLVGVALVLCEGLLRLMGLPRTLVYGWRALDVPTSELNEFGYRGHRQTTAADVDTVVLAGDSQVSDFEFDQLPEVYLARFLEQRTGRPVRVVSVAAGGWGTDQELLALREVLPRLHPRYVCLWFTPFNDLWNNTFPTNWPTDGYPKPTFWLDHDTLLGPDAPFMAAYRPPGLRLLGLIERAHRRWAGLPRYPSDREWEARMPPPYSPLAPSAGAPQLRDFLATERGISPADIPYLDQENFVTEKTHYALLLTPPSPRLAYSVQLSRKLLQEVERLSGNNGAGFMVFYHMKFHSFPAEPTVFQVPSGEFVRLSSQTAEDTIHRMMSGLPAMKVDQLPSLWARSPTDGHLNDAAKQVVMRDLCDWLVSHHGLQPGH